MLPLGLTLSPSGAFLPPRVLDLTGLAEELGYRTVWYPESNQADALALAHAASARTSRIRLGTAVIPIQTRTPALVAMSCSVLSYLAPGRFVLGIGHSSPNVVGRWHGREFDPNRPLEQVREFVAAVKACLAQERVVFEGKWYRIDGFRMRLAPNPAGGDLSVVVGVLGDRALERAITFPDGALMSYVLPDRLQRLAKTAAASGRPGFEMTVSLNVAVLRDGTSAERVALDFRRQIVNYAIVDAYANAFSLAGYGEEVRRIREAWDSGDRKAALRAVPPSMCLELAAFGSAQEVAARIRAYLDAGAAEVAISLVESEDTLGAEESLEAIAAAMSA